MCKSRIILGGVHCRGKHCGRNDQDWARKRHRLAQQAQRAVIRHRRFLGRFVSEKGRKPARCFNGFGARLKARRRAEKTPGIDAIRLGYRDGSRQKNLQADRQHCQKAGGP